LDANRASDRVKRGRHGKQSVCDARTTSSGKQPIFTDFNLLIMGQNIIIYFADFSIISYLDIFQNCVIFQ
jgi:hypothetical protein